MDRYVIAHLFEGHAASEIARLRRHHDPRTADAIAPHLTLCGPHNTPNDPESICTVAAGVLKAFKEFRYNLEHVGTFLPRSNTVFVTINPWNDVASINRHLVENLGWTPAYSYHPHITITEYLDTVATQEAYETLKIAKFGLSARLKVATLLTKRVTDGKWLPLREFALAD